jgi:YVTN family beta-propeller protein
MPTKYGKIVAATVLAVSAGAISYAQTVTKIITLPGVPEQIAVDPLTDRIYVAVPNFGTKPYDYLTVINGKTDTVIGSYEIPAVAYAIAVDPVRGVVYIGGTYTDINGIVRSEVVGFSTCENKVEKVVPVSTTPGDGIQGIAVNDISGDVYVTNGSDNEVDVIWAKSAKVDARISVSGEPYGIAVNPFLNTAYAGLLDGGVTVINGKTYSAVTTEISSSAAYTGIATNLLTGKVYTANSDGGIGSTVAELTSNGTFLENIGVGNTPIGIDVDPGKSAIFVANTQDGTVDVINSTTNVISKTLPVSGLFLAVDPFSHKVYVGSNSGTPTVTVITE